MVLEALSELVATPGRIAMALTVVAWTVVTALGADGGGLSKEFPWQFRLAAQLRTPLLVFIVVPLSFMLRIRNMVRRRVRRLFRGTGGPAAAARHAENVASIQSSLEAWNLRGRPCKLRTARPNWASMSLKLGSNKGECHLVRTSHMDNILNLDVANLMVRAEPGVTMGELTDVLVPLGLSLQTHVEMESITLGGVAMGFGIETNSHIFGFFQESVLEYELLDSRGKLHTVTAASDPELFYAMPWSHGTIGFLTALTVRLVRTKPYVHMVYEPTSTSKVLTRRLTQLAALPEGERPDFLEATAYDTKRSVIQAGYYVDAPPAGVTVNAINSFWKPFFFRHVETFLDTGKAEEAIPLKDFLHRFTRSIFWELEDMIPFSNHPIYR